MCFSANQLPAKDSLLHIAARGASVFKGRSDADAADYATTLRILATGGVNINGRGVDDVVPLMHAARADTETLCTVLLQRGASTKTEYTLCDKYGSLMDVACVRGNIDIVKVLANAGADVESEHVEEAADESALKECLKRLRNKKKRKKQMLKAAAAGDLESFKDLMAKYQFKPDTANDHGQTPLSKAAYHGHDAIVSHLISEGANVNLADKQKAVPLHWASGQGHAKCAEMLLDAGANINVGACRERRVTARGAQLTPRSG